MTSQRKHRFRPTLDVLEDRCLMSLSPIGTVPTDQPTFTWNSVSGGDHYDIWVNDATTGKSQVLRNLNATGTSWTPAQALSPGHSYRWWVRALDSAGIVMS